MTEDGNRTVAPAPEHATMDEVRDLVRKVKAHQAAGRFDLAHQLLDQIEAKRGELPVTTHYRGLTVALSGDAARGEALMLRALDASPDDPVLNVDMGVLLAQTGRMEQAETLFRTAVEIAPNYDTAQANLGAVLLAGKEYLEAIRHLTRAAQLNAQNIDVHVNLGIALQEVKNYAQASDALYRALAIDPLHVQAHVQLANVLFFHERHDAAEHHARRAMELGQGNVAAEIILARILSSVGRMDEAEALLLDVAARPRQGLRALTNLIQLRKTRPDSPEIEGLEQAMAQLDQLEPPARMSIHFAAAKAYDDLGRYDTAFENLKAGNDISAGMHPFDADSYTNRATQLKALAAPELVANWKSDAIDHIAPVFITGMPRSGTTLTEQMLSRHSAITAGGEMRAMPVALSRTPAIRRVVHGEAAATTLTPEDARDLGAAYMDGARTMGIRAERFTDKMPANYLHAGLIAAALPRAKILVMRRHPLDCLLSNYMQQFGDNQTFSTRFDHLATVYRIYEDMTHRIAAAFPDRVRLLNYEDLTRDAQAQMRGLLDWIGLEWEPAVLDFSTSSRAVNTASVAQVREPIYSRSVARWQNYAPYLAGLAEPLRDLLTDGELQALGLA